MTVNECKELRTTLRHISAGLLTALNQSTDRDITRALSDTTLNVDRIIGSVNMIQRILEANKLGFKRIFISSFNLKSVFSQKKNIEITPVKKVEDLFGKLFT